LSVFIGLYDEYWSFLTSLDFVSFTYPITPIVKVGDVFYAPAGKPQWLDFSDFVHDCCHRLSPRFHDGNVIAV
jgi:hypothetical protein